MFSLSISMKRASSLNYLNKSSDETFQVMISFCKDLHFVVVFIYFWMLHLNLCCFLARIEGAVISGRAVGSAPALWISTLETEQQAVLFTHPKTLLPLLFLPLAFGNRTVGQCRVQHAFCPHAWPKDPLRFPLIRMNTYVTSLIFFPLPHFCISLVVVLMSCCLGALVHPNCGQENLPYLISALNS